MINDTEKNGECSKETNTKAQPTEIHQTKTKNKTTCQTIWYLVWYCKWLDIHFKLFKSYFSQQKIALENRISKQTKLLTSEKCNDYFFYARFISYLTKVVSISVVKRQMVKPLIEIQVRPNILKMFVGCCLST